MGLLDDLVDGVADFFGLGGSGGGSSVTYGVESTIQGGNKPVAVTSVVEGGSKPVALTSTIQGGNKAVVLDVGLDDVNIEVGGTGTALHSISQIEVPNPIATETDVDFAFTQPIVSDISSKLDVEPLQVDLCIDVGLTKLPKARIHQPYESHFGVTVFGTEIVGFDLTGQSDVVLDDLQSRPHVELGAKPGRHHQRPQRSHRRQATLGRAENGGVSIRLD